jgi:hypothetical protein
MRKGTRRENEIGEDDNDGAPRKDSKESAEYDPKSQTLTKTGYPDRKHKKRAQNKDIRAENIKRVATCPRCARGTPKIFVIRHRITIVIGLNSLCHSQNDVEYVSRGA